MRQEPFGIGRQFGHRQIREYIDTDMGGGLLPQQPVERKAVHQRNQDQRCSIRPLRRSALHADGVAAQHARRQDRRDGRAFIGRSGNVAARCTEIAHALRSLRLPRQRSTRQRIADAYPIDR